ncbi:MAG: hypothetical protein MJK08_13815 [Campylobacterales bacterium]|nr:hypothetical protein [Campylobacterales bacterium]
MNLLDDLYTIVYTSELKYIIKFTNKNHAVFKAHFLNNELVPGFLQIEIIAKLMNHKIKNIKKAKFISVIRPNDTVEYLISKKNNIQYSIKISKEDKKISEITYEI